MGVNVGVQKLVNSGILSNIYTYIYSQCNIRGESQVLTQGFFAVLHLHWKYSVNYNVSFSEVLPQSLDGSLVGVGMHFPPIMCVLWQNWLCLLSFAFIGVRVIMAWSSLFAFSRQIYVSSSPLMLNTPCVCFDSHFATQSKMNQQVPSVLQFWAEAPWNSTRHLSSGWWFRPCSQLDLLGSYWESLPYSDALVPGAYLMSPSYCGILVGRHVVKVLPARLLINCAIIISREILKEVATPNSKCFTQASISVTFNVCRWFSPLCSSCGNPTLTAFFWFPSTTWKTDLKAKQLSRTDCGNSKTKRPPWKKIIGQVIFFIPPI